MLKLSLSSIYFGLVLLISLFMGCSDHHKEYFFEASQIKDHPTPNQVIAIMHTNPDSSFDQLFFGKNRFIQLYYKEDSVEFRFKDKNGKLLETIIHKPSLTYLPESITKFGLKYIEPVEQDTSSFFRWKNQYNGFDMINFYKIGSRKSKQKTNYKIYFRLKQ